MNIDREKTCLTCFKKFIPSGYSNPSKYCSRKCYYHASRGVSRPDRDKRKTISCMTCNKKFKVKLSLVSKTKYCSKSCDPHFNHDKISIRCEKCDNIIKVPKCLRSRRFCSDTCRTNWFAGAFIGKNHALWKGGEYNKYGSNWTKQKQKVRLRDLYKCKGCKIPEWKLSRNLDVHHIKPFKEFGKNFYRKANRSSNLVSLCRKCHKFWEHQTEAWQREQIFLSESSSISAT